MSGLTDRMSFLQRTWNFLIKIFFARPFMYFHTFTVDKVPGLGVFIFSI
jgi:hypothetical protein